MRSSIIVLALLLAGCTGSAEKTEFVRDYKIDRLFDVDGCVMYRFQDEGVSRYFVICQDGSTRTEWTRRVWMGKFAKSYNESIPVAVAKGSSR